MFAHAPPGKYIFQAIKWFDPFPALHYFAAVNRPLNLNLLLTNALLCRAAVGF